MEDERVARVWLSGVCEPGDVSVWRMVKALGAVEAVAAIQRGRVHRESGATEKKVTGWGMRAGAFDLEGALFICAQYGGRVVCPGDAEWPSTLDQLGESAPLLLWVRGELDLRAVCLRSVAVVGARAATPYGIRAAADLGAELSDRGWTVVSGGALGIDGAAHRGALAADGNTVAVLASGVDVAYPPRHEGLFAEIAAKGLLVSEWPPTAHPTRPRFLVRNRVIAALTRGTVVVEADLRSGALNTAHHARSLGRQLMAYPGPVTSLMSRGCHDLLRASPPHTRLVTGVDDVLEEVGPIGEGLDRPDGRPILPRDHLDPDTRAVLEAIPAGPRGTPTHAIAAAASLDLPTTRSRLALLAATGFTTRTRTGWRLNPPT
ncbi:DNA-processing protein DprA [Actinocorallia sp. A-T 12471]|uniref:DNA-processing protein DprA n=1 Tax=Actinocorallia sp. A-T 12471 TaxID=3089813 RepID=UPI0029D1A635|nr:DNA-processing protein DprA [Actinocorallia sp. A-T 12471]MDX6739130.1 DNA-processing protein DprA [Actinocorallia sp. A-T 12471]